MLVCVSGTFFGRDVVPDVGSTNATSVGLGEAMASNVRMFFPCKGEETCLGLKHGR